MKKNIEVHLKKLNSSENFKVNYKWNCNSILT